MTNPAATLGRLWRTVRWLKPRQVLGRLGLRLPRPRPSNDAPPALRKAAGQWVRPAERVASLVGPTRWRLLAQEHDLAEVGWDDPRLALLWRYNQHYFDDVNAAGAASRRDWHRELVRCWIAGNAPGAGTAWAPYPTSLRIVNWVKWFVGGETVQTAWARSLAMQARWLAHRLEWHLLGNHLFANAKALMFAGLYFDGSEAQRWVDTGQRLIARELPEQVLADGGHFERSPMYHALALEDLLDLLNLLAARAPAEPALQALAEALRVRATSMLCWLRCLRHPSGGLARFNDCADGIAPAASELERYAAALGITADDPPGEGVELLQPSGYVRLARGRARALLDLAPVGPDHLPGHAHADTLSFELSLGAREIIVNRGTSVYGTGCRRQWERGTAAHNTVQIGNHDSSEVWAGFRVGRRARPGPIRLDGWTVEGSHDGYCHLARAPRHRRRWLLGDDGLLVEDWLDPVPSEPALAHWHLAPGLALGPIDGSTWRISENGVQRALLRVQVGSASVSITQHAPAFGILVDAPTLAVRLQQGHAAVRIAWDR